MNISNQSLQGRAFDNLNAAYKNIPVKSIAAYSEDEIRPIDKKAITDMEASIESIGLRQPIGLGDGHHTENNDHYRVIYGKIRFTAWRNKYEEALATFDDTEESKQRIARWEHIPAYVYPKTLEPQIARLIAIEENLTRQDLTEAQRKKFRGEREELRMLLIEKEIEEMPVKPARKHPKDWINVYAERSNITLSKANREWLAYREADSVVHTPGKATDAEIDEFFTFLIGRADDQRDTEKKAKTADRNGAVDSLVEILQKHDDDIVKEAVSLWWTGKWVEFRD